MVTSMRKTWKTLYPSLGLLSGQLADLRIDELRGAEDAWL